MAWGRVYGEGLLVDYSANAAAVYGSGLLVDYGIVAGTPHAAVYGMGLLVDYRFTAVGGDVALIQGEFLLQDVQFQGSELWDGPGQIVA